MSDAHQCSAWNRGEWDVGHVATSAARLREVVIIPSAPIASRCRRLLRAALQCHIVDADIERLPLHAVLFVLAHADRAIDRDGLALDQVLRKSAFGALAENGTRPPKGGLGFPLVIGHAEIQNGGAVRQEFLFCIFAKLACDSNRVNFISP